MTLYQIKPLFSVAVKADDVLALQAPRYSESSLLLHWRFLFLPDCC